MKKNILIFAGTTEGRQLAEYAVKKGIPCIVSAATEYGEELLENDLQLQKEKHKKSELRVIQGRMDQQEMEAFFEKEQVGLVIDATHPFAVIVTVLSSVKKSLKHRKYSIPLFLHARCIFSVTITANGCVASMTSPSCSFSKNASISC